MYMEIWRGINIVLAICYSPLLYLRIKDTSTREDLPYLVGMYFILASIVAGSIHYLSAQWSPGLPLCTLGLVIVMTVSGRRQWIYWRRPARRRHGR